MIPAEVADHFKAHRIADGQWRGKCPAHDGQSHNSLSIQAARDGKTLLRCWGGCETEDVLTSAGLSWEDLFPPSSSSQPRKPVDPQIALQRRAEAGLREWKEHACRTLGYRTWLRHRLIAKGEKLVAEGMFDKGWDLLQLGYLGLSRLTWSADLLDSKNREDWEEARKFLGVEL